MDQLRQLAPFRDVPLLAARVAVGIVFMAHGWQKLVTNGLDATTAGFTRGGVPVPRLSALYSGVVELVGGACLVVGLLLPVVGLLLFLDMAGAFVFIHVGNGLMSSEGGFEFVMVLGTTSLLLAFIGAGPFSIDRLLLDRRRGSAAREGSSSPRSTPNNPQPDR
ncbi:MAG: DoxX family protein [Acidimicrobiia bacterium]